MPYIIQGGIPVRVEQTVTIERVTPAEPPDLACPECGKEYKTERGLENHKATH